ncbi:MAG: dihydroneopterin triphosphate diphosphatase [Candidatus Accumulibacter sp.]|jgi:dATP pyrophosphohydrolase|nr:dihydroneopterin triphosphate diphosphatase [Accumulibacter sp.]
MTGYKRPVSVLAVIHTKDLRILLLERALFPGYWQSVTGSLEENESPFEAARREVFEETGIAAPARDFRDWRITNVFGIHMLWRHRYAPDVEYNTEHVYSLEAARESSVRLAPGEHSDYCWLPWEEAVDKCFSWSNRDAIQLIAREVMMKKERNP